MEILFLQRWEESHLLAGNLLARNMVFAEFVNILIY
jgi:hypothetical protein